MHSFGIVYRYFLCYEVIVASVLNDRCHFYAYQVFTVATAANRLHYYVLLLEHYWIVKFISQ